MEFSIVVPTYNREKDLKECIKSIIVQSCLPSEVIIIDDGNLHKNFIENTGKKLESKEINLVYYEKDHLSEPRGSNESRNIGIEIAKEDIVFIFDDDTVLTEDFLSEIMNTWDKNKNDNKLVGVSGIAENYRKKDFLEKTYNKFFGLSSRFAWDVNNVAFQVWDMSIKNTQKGYYMCGFCCSYRKDIAKNIKFTIFKGGRGGNVDPDFSLKAKNKGYYFLINPKAKVIHNRSPISREKSFVTGFKESSNRKISFENNCEKTFKNYIWFYWANTGWILRQLFSGKFMSGIGMIKGLAEK